MRWSPRTDCPNLRLWLCEEEPGQLEPRARLHLACPEHLTIAWVAPKTRHSHVLVTPLHRAGTVFDLHWDGPSGLLTLTLPLCQPCVILRLPRPAPKAPLVPMLELGAGEILYIRRK
jgi:hypothetical protein